MIYPEELYQNRHIIKDRKQLSPAEMAVLCEVILGKSNAEIGEVFETCEKTVKYHLTSIYKKFGIPGEKNGKKMKLMMELNLMKMSTPGWEAA